MRCTLKNPYQTQHHIANCENKNGGIERSDESLGNCDAQKKQTDRYLGECQSRKGLDAFQYCSDKYFEAC